MATIHKITLLAAVFMAVHSTCIAGDMTGAQAKSGVFTGEVRLVGNGAAWSWVECDAKGTPTRFGITLTETALKGLPADTSPSQGGSWEFPLSLPARVDLPPYTHIVVNWEPKGHVPAGIYDVPHFDFHFYMIDTAQREKITCQGPDQPKCDAKPDAGYMPDGYILPQGTEAPRMGAHWIDPSSPEFNKHPFTRTFIYGSYDAHLAFLEPMAAISYLETKPDDANEAVKVPAAYQRRGYYPTAYSVKYDPARKEYTIALEGLALK